MNRSIIVKTQLEALHHWPNIPSEHPMQFLKHSHRHIFHIELKFKVGHNDRDLEFIDVKYRIDLFLKEYFRRDTISGLVDMGATSCETLCEILLNGFEYLGAFEATVLEDGEMGSTLTFGD